MAYRVPPFPELWSPGAAGGPIGLAPAHPWDIEFDDTALPAAWQETFTPGGDIDVYGFTAGSGDPRRQVGDYRDSHYTIQAPSDGGFYALHRQETLPDNILMWARCSVQVIGSGAPVNNDNTFGLFMAADDGGGQPDFNNYVGVFVNESDANTLQTQVQRVVGGVATTIHTGNNLAEMPQPTPYVAIHKRGETYHFWIGSDAGGWMWCGSYASNWTLEHVGLLASNVSGVGPANKVSHCDFIRFQEETPRDPVEYVGAAARYERADYQIGFFWYHEVPLPAGIQVGDLLLLSRCSFGVAAGDNPAGWTAETFAGGGDPTLRLSSKIADAGDVSSGMVTVSHGGVSNDALNTVVSAYRNVNPLNPLVVIGAGLRPGSGILSIPTATTYEWDVLNTLSDSEAIYYSMGTINGSAGVAATLELPNSPSVPVGFANQAALVGSIGRSVTSFHEIIDWAGPAEEWVGNRENNTIAFYAARILPAG